MPEPDADDAQRDSGVKGVLLEISTEVLRNGLVLVALLSCVGVILAGVTADHVGWTVGAIAAGLVGGALVIAAMVRQWRGWQWLVYLTVIAANVGLIALAAG